MVEVEGYLMIYVKIYGVLGNMVVIDFEFVVFCVCVVVVVDLGVIFVLLFYFCMFEVV